MVTLLNDESFLFSYSHLFMSVFGESVVNRDSNLLPTWHFHLSSSQGFQHDLQMFFFTSDGNELFTDFNSASFSVRFTIRSSHTGLKSISSGARKHFINSEYVPWMFSHSEMEILFGQIRDDIFVDGNSASLKSFRSDLFLFIGNHMNTVWESVPFSFFVSSVIKSEFSIRNGSVVSGFWESFSFNVSITFGWSSTHLY